MVVHAREVRSGVNRSKNCSRSGRRGCLAIGRVLQGGLQSIVRAFKSRVRPRPCPVLGSSYAKSTISGASDVS